MSAFTDEQINEIIGIFTQHIGTHQYIGARYVPIFGRKDETSIIWDNTAPYEPLTIVLYQGNSYTSRQYVPAGVDILNTDFWANTGNYNAQIEQYRSEVLTFDNRISSNTTAIANETTNRTNADTALQANIDAEEQARISAVDAEEQARINADTSIGNSITQIQTDITSIKNRMPYDDFDNITIREYIDNAVNVYFKDEYILLLGDSYAQGVGGIDANTNGINWMDILENMLHLQNVYKYKGGSAGFVTTSTSTSGSSSSVPTGTTYNQILDYAYEYLNNINKAQNIKHIVIQGGWNDSNSGSLISTTQAAVEACLINIRNKFPNAKVYIVGTYCGSQAKNSTATKTQVSRMYKNAATKYGATFTETVNLPWIYQNASHDTVHPTQEMQYLMAGFIAQTLLFGYAEDFTNVDNVDVETYITPDHCIYYRQGVINNPNVDWSQNPQPLIAPERFTRATVSGRNVDYPFIYTAGDNQQYIGMFRFYVNGSIRWLHRGGYQGNTISVVNFANIKLPFH